MIDVLEAKMFKAVPGGYVFQPPPPTIFHDNAAYVVNESQKLQIMAMATDQALTWRRGVTFIALALGVAAGIARGVIGQAPLMPSVGLGFCLWAIAQIGGTALGFHIKLRQLGPFLAELPRSEERLFPEANRRELLSRLPSPRWAIIWCAMVGIIFGYQSAKHFPFTDAASIAWLMLLVLTLAAFRVTSHKKAADRR
jgi:hypothetical protein